MAVIANLTVKKNDGTTDILWTGVQGGSTRDRPATWQSATVGTATAHRPELRLWMERSNGGKGTCTLTGQYPSISTDSTTGITSIIGRQRMKVVWEIDQNMPQADCNEFVAQMTNLEVQPLIRDAIRALFAIT